MEAAEAEDAEEDGMAEAEVEGGMADTDAVTVTTEVVMVEDGEEAGGLTVSLFRLLLALRSLKKHLVRQKVR